MADKLLYSLNVCFEINCADCIKSILNETIYNIPQKAFLSLSLASGTWNHSYWTYQLLMLFYRNGNKHFNNKYTLNVVANFDIRQYNIVYFGDKIFMQYYVYYSGINMYCAHSTTLVIIQDPQLDIATRGNFNQCVSQKASRAIVKLRTLPHADDFKVIIVLRARHTCVLRHRQMGPDMHHIQYHLRNMPTTVRALCLAIHAHASHVHCAHSTPVYTKYKDT